MGTFIKTGLLGGALMLMLAACQNMVPTGNMPGVDLGRNQPAVLAQIVQKTEQADVYFSTDGQYHNAPVAGGYYRKVLGKTAAGGWVVQDFYQDSKSKQTDAFVLFHPNGLRNFDNDVVDGAVVWYREDGSVSQSAVYARGKLAGWVTHYDEQSHARRSLRFADDEATGEQQTYNEQGRLVMRTSVDAQQQWQQEFWYDNGKPAATWREQGLRAWDEQGRELNEMLAEHLVEQLESRLYQPQE